MEANAGDHSEETVEDLHGRMEAGTNESGTEVDLAVVVATATLVDDSSKGNNTRGRSCPTPKPFVFVVCVCVFIYIAGLLLLCLER
jgi:hypothetical protein